MSMSTRIEIRRIPVARAAVVAAFVAIGIALLLTIWFVLLILLGRMVWGNLPQALVQIWPSAASGWIAALVCVVLYNAAARCLGGILLETEEQGQKKSEP